MKKQIEDAEEIATLTQAKYRKAQAEAEEAEEKMHLTEQALFKLRSTELVSTELRDKLFLGVWRNHRLADLGKSSSF